MLDYEKMNDKLQMLQDELATLNKEEEIQKDRV